VIARCAASDALPIVALRRIDDVAPQLRTSAESSHPPPPRGVALPHDSVIGSFQKPVEPDPARCRSRLAYFLLIDS